VPLAANERRVACANPAAIARRQVGAIFIGLHFCNWEVTVVPAAQFGERPIGIYKPLRSAGADAYLRKLRAGLYPAGLLPASPATLLKLARHLRDGGSACMLADHRDLNGTVVPFFGYSAPSATLPALMAVKYGLPIYAARVDRLYGVRFSVHIERVTVPLTVEISPAREKDGAHRQWARQESRWGRLRRRVRTHAGNWRATVRQAVTSSFETQG
jgi:lauroyl/myristoyl acyltransferase